MTNNLLTHITYFSFQVLQHSDRFKKRLLAYTVEYIFRAGIVCVFVNLTVETEIKVFG